MPKPKLLVHPMPVARPLLMILVATFRDPGVSPGTVDLSHVGVCGSAVGRRSDTERVR